MLAMMAVICLKCVSNFLYSTGRASQTLRNPG